MKEATNATVSDIDVVVERPLDSDRLQNNVRSNDATENISGTGGSGTLVTNNSSGNWYLDAVSVSALSVTTPGVVVVDVAVENSNGTTLVDQTIDVTEAQLDFSGVIVRPDWSITYEVNQDDSNSYAVVIRPLIRKPQPGSSSGGGEGESEDTSIIDSFEDAGITEYSGDTGAFTTQTADTYHLDTALETTSSTGVSITSTSGLDNYPGTGDSFAFELKAMDIGDNETMRASGLFNIDGSDAYEARLNFGDRKLLLLDTAGGTTTIIDESHFLSALDPDHWYSIRVDYGTDAVDMTLRDPDSGTNMSSLSGAASEFSRGTGSGSGWGWYGSVHDGADALRYDNARLIS